MVIDLSTVVIHNSPDVRDWPATSTITRLEFRVGGVHIEHTKRDGPGAWPNFRPPGWDGDLQYTLWLIERIDGVWHASGGIQYWQDCDQNGGAPENFAASWFYAPDRWAPMTGYQPAPGETVGFMVTAGDARNNGTQSVQERSNIVVLPFPVSGSVYAAVAPPEPDPVPVPLPATAPAWALDALRRLTTLEVRMDELAEKAARKGDAVAVKGMIRFLGEVVSTGTL